MQIIKVGGEVENLSSVRYKFTVVDIVAKEVEIVALGLNMITSDISDVKGNKLLELFSNADLCNYNRPESGSVDCLIGFDHASLHPVKQQAVGNLLLLSNQFGVIVAGSHP